MVRGLQRYVKLRDHIANPLEYLLNRSKRDRRDFNFTTRPRPIRFRVPSSLYLLFKELFMNDVYDIDTLVGQLPAAPVVIDVGANAGFFTIQLLSKIETAMVYAYEPIPGNVALFTDTLHRNPRLRPYVRLFQRAVCGQTAESLDLFAEPEQNSQVVASAFAGFSVKNAQRITVPCITLTDIIEGNNLLTVDLLKMDCEGSEYDIIYHTDPTLIKRINRLYIEVHDMDRHRNNITAFASYIRSLGYVTTHLPINSFCHALEAVRAENR